MIIEEFEQLVEKLNKIVDLESSRNTDNGENGLIKIVNLECDFDIVIQMESNKWFSVLLCDRDKYRYVDLHQTINEGIWSQLFETTKIEEVYAFIERLIKGSWI